MALLFNVHIRCSKILMGTLGLVKKPLYTFGTEQKIKVHRFTNNLKGLQKVMMKDLP